MCKIFYTVLYGVDFNFKYPFLSLLTALVTGILCQNNLLAIPVYFFCLLLFLAFLTLYLKALHRYSDVLLLTCVFCCGIYLTPQPASPPLPANLYKVHSRCEEVLPPCNYILSIQKQKFYLSGYHADSSYLPGDSLLCYARFSQLRDNSNPGEFSYKKYLQQKEVRFQLIPVSKIEKKGRSHNLFFVFNNLRRYFINKTASLIKDTTCCSLINALCLGARNDMDSEIRQLFITTGTVHLLSVSGLHTGAVYLFILFIFRVLRIPDKYRRTSALPLLWGYALLTGLSPSVVRAATILSFISAGKICHRTYIPLNAIAASAFITLLIQPFLLFSVSFQLSYCAYTGIIILYPLLYKMIKLPSILSSIYACFCVSISAQLLTLPISAYYFHTINISGILVNLLAIPLATLLLYSALLCLLLPAIIAQYLAYIPEIGGKCLIYLLHFFEPFSVNIKQLYPPSAFIILIYVSLLSLVLYFLYKKNFWLKNTAMLLLLSILWMTSINIKNTNRQEIVIFHIPRKSALLLNYQGHYTFLANNTTTSSKWIPYIYQNKLDTLPSGYEFLNSSLQWHTPCLYTAKDTLFLLNTYSGLPIRSTILIVTDNLLPAKAFPSASNNFPRLVVCDGSNTTYTNHCWKQFCLLHQIPVRTTAEEGYIRLSLK